MSHLTLRVIRPDDLLNLVIQTDNLRLESDLPVSGEQTAEAPSEGTAFLVADDPAQPGLLRVLFPPQHIAEFAVFESDPRPTLTPDTSGSSAKATNDAREAAQAKEPGADKSTAPLESLDPDPLPVPGTEPFKARIAAASRLVFRVPRDRRIPYTIDGLLDWRGLEPMLHPIAAIAENAAAAQRTAAPPISAPTVDQTALELPYRLLISPNGQAIWQHRTRPFGPRGRYEMWHTRLVGEDTDGIRELDTEHTAPLRALWSPDYRPGLQPAPRNRQGTTGIGRSALSDDDRHQLVVLTSAFHGYETDLLIPRFSVELAGAVVGAGASASTRRPFHRGSATYVPKPFQASQVMLSPLGGWLKSRGAWTPPRTAGAVRPFGIFEQRTIGDFRDLLDSLVRADGSTARLRSLVDQPEFGFSAAQAKPDGEQLDLSEWVHVATQGRDHYVRVVYEGELWPFRHKAAMVKITERKFIQGPDAIVVACLVQRVFIVVRQPEVSLKNRHDVPLQQVRLTTLVTPNLAEPCIEPGLARSFWVDVGTLADRRAFRFHAVGIDQAGRKVDFHLPLVFASISDVEGGKKPRLAALYNATLPAAGCARPPDRHADFLGAKLAFTALPGSENPLLATERVWFKAEPDGQAPGLLRAEVKIPALSELLGKDDPIRIAYDDTGPDSYVTGGGYTPANVTGVFAKLVDDQGAQRGLSLGFRADQAGGFATPNQTITALSRDQGPVAGDIAAAIADRFEPKQVFPPAASPGLPGLPLLFGTFGLDALLVKDGSSLSSQAPKITTRRDGNTLVTELEWNPEVKANLTVGVADFVKKGGERRLEIRGETQTPLGNVPPSSLFTGTLKDFDVVLLSSVTIHFTEFAFASRNGEKPSVKVALDTVKPLEFSGDLEFIEDLRNAIPPGLFGDGASLEVTAAGIRAGFSVGLPPLDIGVFALKDVSLGGALTLPYLDGKPILDFNVSERANPFQLRVAFFAGGGFFHLQMDTAGMRQLEASLEFGAAFGLSIAVATGEVHAMAGIYFAITREDDGKNYCTLTGFMRLGGRLSVIGIIRLSVEFNLSFTYQESSDKAFGRATVTVMVEVLLISLSVELTVERAFGGAGDPVFQQTFPDPGVWHDYASAFA